jgi:hypothetical protein
VWAKTGAEAGAAEQAAISGPDLIRGEASKMHSGATPFFVSRLKVKNTYKLALTLN